MILISNSVYNSTGRRRTRTIDRATCLAVAERIAEQAIAGQRPVIESWNGGAVANSYSKKGYGPVTTECAVAVALPTGDVVVWRGECRAQNVKTLTGPAASLPVDPSYFDGRCGAERRAVSWHAILERAHQELANPSRNLFEIALSSIEIPVGSELNIALECAFATLAAS